MLGDERGREKNSGNYTAVRVLVRLVARLPRSAPRAGEWRGQGVKALTPSKTSRVVYTENKPVVRS